MTQPLPQNCPNCGRHVEGHFCSYCGQRHESMRLTIGSVVESLTSTLFGNNLTGIKGHSARYGIVYTLKMLFRHPGRLIGEYLSGKRIKYFDPVTLVLLLSTVYALLAALFDIDAPIEFDNKEDDDPALNEILARVFTYFRNTPWFAYLVQLPFMAFSLRILFRRNRHRMYYMEYFYVGIFIAIIMLVVSMCFMPIEVYGTEWLKGQLPAIRMAIRGVVMVVLFRSLYRAGWLRSIWYSCVTQVITICGALLSLGLFIIVLIFFYCLINNDL